MDRRDDELQPLIDKISWSRKPIMPYILASFISGQFYVMFGVNQGYSSILLGQLQNPKSSIQINDDQASWIASLALVFQPVGALCAGYVIDRFGRKRTMQGLFVGMGLSWLLMGFSRGLYAIYASRTLIGLVLGLSSCATIYINEISKSTYRGTLISITELYLSAGTVLVYVLGYKFNWEIVAVLLALYSLIVFFLLFLIPESYVWYMATGKKNEAIESMLWFEKDATIVERDILALETKLRTFVWKKNNYLIVFKNRKLRNRLFIFLLFIVIQYMSGTVTITGYSVSFFDSLQTPYDGNVLSIIFGFVAFLSASVLIFTIHKFNRKTLMSFSGLGMTIFMGIGAIAFALPNVNNTITVVCVFLYISFSRMGILNIPSVIASETFPTKARGTVYASRHVFSFLTQFVASKYYFSFISIVGTEGLLLYLAILPFITVVYVTIFFSETKDRSLIDIEDDND